MAIEIVDLPIENGDVPVRFLYVYQRVDGHSLFTKHGFDKYWCWSLLIFVALLHRGEVGFLWLWLLLDSPHHPRADFG